MAGTERAGASYVLVLDLGSSSIRAGLYDAAGRSLGDRPEAQLAYRWRTTPDGGMEAGAEDLFALLVRVVDIALQEARRADLRIAGVATATFWHSLVGVGGDGAPLTPLYNWGDVRATGATLELQQQLDREAVHRRTGCFLHPSYPAAKLRWLRQEQPAVVAEVAYWMSIGEFFGLQLFRQRRCSLSMASGTGLFDLHRMTWDAQMLDAVGIDSGTLSPLVDTDEPFHGLRGEYAQRWPELADIPWFPAIGDGACANVGSGAVGRDRRGLTVGTTAAMRVLWEAGTEVPVPAELWCYRLDRRRVVAGGALSNGGNAVEFLRGTVRLPPESEWEERLAGFAPDAHGLTVLPYLVGERGPGWLRRQHGALIGLQQGTPPLHILRAWLEAISLQIGGIADALESAYGVPSRILASGGALHASPTWTQILADVLGHPLTLTEEPEATSRGAALVALEQLGEIRDLRDPPVTVAAEFAADAARHGRYKEAAERYRAMEALLAPWLDGLRPPDRDAEPFPDSDRTIR